MALSPFTGTDTLKFLFNNKDTQIYVGQGVQSGWQYVYGGDPTLCDKKYEYLIYSYNCINVPDFYFRLEYHQQGVSYRGFLKNVYVGEYEIEATKDDSIYINNNWYYEPYYISNGPDTMQYFML